MKKMETLSVQVGDITCSEVQKLRCYNRGNTVDKNVFQKFRVIFTGYVSESYFIAQDILLVLKFCTLKREMCINLFESFVCVIKEVGRNKV